MIEAGIKRSDLAGVGVPDIVAYTNAVDDGRSRRSREATLRDEINRLVARPDTTRRTLQACTDAIVENLDALLARIWTLKHGQVILELKASGGLYTTLDGAYSRIEVGHCNIGIIAETRVPHLTNTALEDPSLDQDWVRQHSVVSFAGYPLVVDDRVVGVIAMFARFPMAPETLETIGSIAGVIAQGIERKRSLNELRKAIRANHEAVVGERTRIAREMHDGLLQNVTGIALQLRAVLPSVRSAPDEAATVLESILEMTERTTTEARLAVAGIRHFTEPGDLVDALQATAERTLDGSSIGLAVKVRGGRRAMPWKVCDAATSIVQHAITNVVRHAHAQRVQLALNFGVRRLCISVRDDGRGFVPDDATNAAAHFGLLGMHERAREIGAQLRLNSIPERGTTVSILVPYREDSSFG